MSLSRPEPRPGDPGHPEHSGHAGSARAGREALTVLAAIAASIAFGAGAQYLASRIALAAWAPSAAAMSAPWLVLPFLAGLTQPSGRRAAVLGLAATLAALAAYFTMTVSPLEGVPGGRFAPALVNLVRADSPWILGALFTGPAFGLLGNAWRTRRAPASLIVVCGAVLLEPLARLLVHRLPPPAGLWLGESAVGAAGIAWLAWIGRSNPARNGR